MFHCLLAGMAGDQSTVIQIIAPLYIVSLFCGCFLFSFGFDVHWCGFTYIYSSWGSLASWICKKPLNKPLPLLSENKLCMISLFLPWMSDGIHQWNNLGMELSLGVDFFHKKFKFFNVWLKYYNNQQDFFIYLLWIYFTLFSSFLILDLFLL